MYHNNRIVLAYWDWVVGGGVDEENSSVILKILERLLAAENSLSVSSFVPMPFFLKI